MVEPICISTAQKIYLHIKNSIMSFILKPLLYSINGINSSTSSFAKLVIVINRLYFFKLDIVFYSTSVLVFIISNSSYVHRIPILVTFIPFIWYVVASSCFPNSFKSFVTFSNKFFSMFSVNPV